MAQTNFPHDTRWQEITMIWRDNRWLYVIAGLLLGLLVAPALQQVTAGLSDFMGNLVPEAIGIIFTVLIIDRMAANRSRAELQHRLMRETGSQANETAKTAVEWMRAEGWLTVHDKVQLLQGAYLVHANLYEAFLLEADLQAANLHVANLQKAYLRRANLQGANLEGAKLQGANLYKANLRDATLQSALFDETTVLPDANYVGRDEGSNPIFDKHWTPETDMRRYTDPQHPDFWHLEIS
jgi:hypothetical protein